MTIYLGNKELKELYVGNREVKQIYKGMDLVWQSGLTIDVWEKYKTYWDITVPVRDRPSYAIGVRINKHLLQVTDEGETSAFVEGELYISTTHKECWDNNEDAFYLARVDGRDNRYWARASDLKDSVKKGEFVGLVGGSSGQYPDGGTHEDEFWYEYIGQQPGQYYQRWYASPTIADLHRVPATKLYMIDYVTWTVDTSKQFSLEEIIENKMYHKSFIRTENVNDFNNNGNINIYVLHEDDLTYTAWATQTAYRDSIELIRQYDEVVGAEGEYPSNGFFEDGYWYIA